MDVKQQIESGKLVCPETFQKLFLDDDPLWLCTGSQSRRYRFLDSSARKDIIRINEVLEQEFCLLLPR
jgi:hypothetical protein